MDALVLPAAIGVQPTATRSCLEAVAAAITLAVFLFLRFVHLHTHTKCRAGMWVMLLNAALITGSRSINSLAKSAVSRPCRRGRPS